MAADVSVPNNFTAGTPAVADDVDANFTSLVTWINTNATHLDGSKAFTSIPSGPASNPTTDNQLARKAYVDARAAGIVSIVEKTSSQTGITTVADITSMTATWTATSTRRYRVTVTAELGGTTAGDLAILYITDGSNTVVQRAVFTGPALTGGQGYGHVNMQYHISGASGSLTRKVRLERNVGAGTVSLTASSAGPAYLVVEDVGAV